MGEDQAIINGEAAASLAPEQRDDLAAIIAGLERDTALATAADANPLPGPLFEAFDPEPIRFGNIAVRSVVAFDFIVLRKLESPLLARLEQLFKAPEERSPVEFSDAQEADMIQQFTSSIATVRKDIARGVDHFRSRARLLLREDGLPALLRPQLLLGIQAEFARCWSTAIGYESGDKGEGETTLTLATGAEDGLGWWLIYVAGLAKHLPWEQVMFHLPVAQGRALLNAWKETDPWLNVDRRTPGYLRQEIDRLKGGSHGRQN